MFKVLIIFIILNIKVIVNKKMKVKNLFMKEEDVEYVIIRHINCDFDYSRQHTKEFVDTFLYLIIRF